MAIFFLIVFGIYFFVLLMFLVGWERSMNLPLSQSDTMRTISVIVPVRNEEKNINTLIQSAAKLDYPPDMFELIVVDDHSTDQTINAARQALNGLKNARLISSTGAGKKLALVAGIENAKGEIILTTDADCQLPAGLLQKVNDGFNEPRTQLVLGAVRLEGLRGLFSTMQSLEFASLIGSTAASSALGLPLLCNGANLAFRRAAFKKVNGYEGNLQIASGDDEFLMRKVQNLFGSDSIRFLNDGNAVVTTAPQQSVKDFFRQRIRWASKWKYNTSLMAQLAAVFVFVFQLSWVVLLIHNVSEPGNRVMVYLVTTKILLEGLFLWRVALFLQQRFSLVSFFLLQILYPPYVLIVGLLANVVSVNWKERNSVL